MFNNIFTIYNHNTRSKYNGDNMASIIDKDKKHNQKRTKAAQVGEFSKGTKRRVNITIDGSVWDRLDELEEPNKSGIVEELIKKLLKEKGL